MNTRDGASGGSLHSSRQAAALPHLSSNYANRSVFDLQVRHLHPVIALPIITKFLA
jgi:hypothetical protein